MIDPVVIGGAVVVGLYLLDGRPNSGPVQRSAPGDAITAAMTELLNRRGWIIPTWNPDDDAKFSAAANYNLMRQAYVAQYGAAPGTPTGAPLPGGDIDEGDLSALATAWLAAYDAGRKANPQNFALGTDEASGTFINNGSWFNGGDASQRRCAEVTNKTSLGVAACELSSYRDSLDAGTGVPIAESTRETFRLVNRLASEMDGADYVTPGVRNTEQGWQWSSVPGALGAAVSATGGVVVDAAEKVGGAVGDLVLGSNLIWLVVLGGAAYMVLR